MNNLPRHIAVEGPIGVGKTAFTHQLAAALDYDAVLEASELNPFLERFYTDRRQAALQTQLFFLFERSRKVQEMRQADLFASGRITDFVMEKDRLFAEMNLDSDELRLYDNIYAHLTIEAPTPDLVIYLQAPVDILINRINLQADQEQKRPEHNIDRAYLSELVDTYTRFFHYYDEAPLLIVNTAELDLTGNERDFEMLKTYLLTVKNGRHFYNPSAMAGTLHA